MHIGRKDRYLVLDAGLAPRFVDEEVQSAADDQYTFKKDSVEVLGVMPAGSATLRESAQRPLSWLDVMGHAGLFEMESTTITQVPCETAVGRMDCVVYTRDDRPRGRDLVIRSFYASGLPGRPVIHIERACGKTTRFVVLVRHSDPTT
jgi:hypothetical protein